MICHPGEGAWAIVAWHLERAVFAVRRHGQCVTPVIGISADSVGRRVGELSGHLPVVGRKGSWRDKWDLGVAEIVVADEIAVTAGITVFSAEGEIGAIHDFEIAGVADEIGVGVPVDANGMPLAIVVQAARDFLLVIVAVHVHGEANLPQVALASSPSSLLFCS